MDMIVQQKKKCRALLERGISFEKKGDDFSG
jgi:hypothetical protein